MKFVLAWAAFALASAPVSAQDLQNLSVGLGVSSFGGNLEVGYRVDQRFGVRGAYLGGLSAEYDEQDGQTNISGDFELGGLTVMGDYYPMQGNWRVSGGLFFSGSELTARGTEQIGLQTVGLITEAEFKNDVSPVLTTGYEIPLGNNFSLNTEFGVIFTGGIATEFTADDPDDQDDVDNDPDLQQLQDDLEDIGIYPQAAITVSYRF
ncbi:hypothetical protein ACJ5NV_15590 [Loktanella agnita]|uniref:hypothetical protein n=1 Tax=Loktanella agnita TaxID=287097 RepID=UPI00398A2AD8